MKDKLTTMTRHILLIQIEENVFIGFDSII